MYDRRRSGYKVYQRESGETRSADSQQHSSPASFQGICPNSLLEPVKHQHQTQMVRVPSDPFLELKSTLTDNNHPSVVTGGPTKLTRKISTGDKQSLRKVSSLQQHPSNGISVNDMKELWSYSRQRFTVWSIFLPTITATGTDQETRKSCSTTTVILCYD